MPGVQKGKKHKPGAGRPRLYASATQTYNVTLPPELAEAIRDFGGGSLSAGIRRLLFERKVNPPAPLTADVKQGRTHGRA